MGNMAQPHASYLQAAPGGAGDSMTTRTGSVLMTREQVASELNTDPRLIQRAAARRLLESITIPGPQLRFTPEAVKRWAVAGLQGLVPTFESRDWPDNRGDHHIADRLESAMRGWLRDEQAPDPRSVAKSVEYSGGTLEWDVKAVMTPTIERKLRGPADVARVAGEPVIPWGIVAGRYLLRNYARSELLGRPMTSGGPVPWDTLYGSPEAFREITDAAFKELERRQFVAHAEYPDIHVPNGQRMETRQARITLLLPWGDSVLRPIDKSEWIDLSF
jgi:hypothetical protein